MKASAKLVVVVALVVGLAAAEAWAAGPGGRGRAGGGPGNAVRGNVGGGPAAARATGPHAGGPVIPQPGGPQGLSASPTTDQLRQYLNVSPAGQTAGPGPVNRQNGRNAATANQANWTQWQQQANQVRGEIQNRYHDLFTPQWYLDHPYAWQATHPHADAWAAASWAVVSGWVGATVAQPTGYSYGSSVVYEGDTVYINDEAETWPVDPLTGEPLETTPAGSATPPGNGDWLPLGVFTMTGVGQTSGDRVIQLAVAKDGTLSGTYYDAISRQDLPVQGTVNRQTQRATWTVGAKSQAVMETLLENLTKDEAPLSVHFGPDQTQDWLLIRLEPQETGTNP